ncbi:exodeoxyribonuclease VII small subunit [Dendrosporobacter sp. 1207_IL3150]|uniref:exodeoxyribonuclease VII small subunit n=1 Tax=Dendrosporobacter sp. 1207_IL3150 TaxID=3084054 RepID=UPI002FDA20A0
MRKDIQDNVDLSFEEALGRLEGIVRQLEKGDASLDDLLAKFSEGINLSQLCLSKLNSAEQIIDKIVQSEQGKITEKPLLLQEGE